MTSAWPIKSYMENSALLCGQVSKQVVEGIIERLDKKFAKDTPLATSRGKILEYLGMTIDYTEKGKIKISMFKYVKKLIDGY